MYEFNRDFNYLECPCKGCTERNDHCHPECGKYNNYLVRLKEFSKKKRAVEERGYISDTKKRWLWRKQRREKR